MYVFNVLVKSLCPNGIEDVRAYNEVGIDQVVNILNSIELQDAVTVTLFDEKVK